jgi:HK97 family phage prohead protease
MIEGYAFRGTGAAAADGWTLSAHAAVTGVDYGVRDEFGEFTEHLHPGSFRDSLSRGPDLHMLVNHTGLSLARTRSGTLRLAEDDRGLRYTADLDPASPNAQALRSAVQRGDISESSFAFLCTQQEWSADYLRRDIYGVDIDGGDVSACNFGCNKATGEPDSAASLRAGSAPKKHYKGVTAAAMAKFKADIKDSSKNSTSELSSAIRRLSQYAASGNLPHGTTYADLKTMYNAICTELKRRNPDSSAGGNFPALGSGRSVGPVGLETRCPAMMALFDDAGQEVETKSAGRFRTVRALPAPLGLVCNCCPPCAPSTCDGSCCEACPCPVDAIVNAFVATSSLDTPSAESLGLPDYSLEARLTILKLKAGPPPAPLTKAEKTTRMIARGATADAAIRRRIEELKRRGKSQ